MSAVATFTGNRLPEAHDDKRYRAIFDTAAPAGYSPSPTEIQNDVIRFPKPFSGDTLLQEARQPLNQPPAFTVKRGKS